MNFLRKSMHYLGARVRWELAGRPVVSAAIRDAREAKCKTCPHYVDTTCKLCGCPLVDTALGDKLLWATEGCPDKPSRWLPMVGVDEVSPTSGVIIGITFAGHTTGFIPQYADPLTLTMGDIVAVNASWDGKGQATEWHRLGDLVQPDFTGAIKVLTGFNADHTTDAPAIVTHAMLYFMGGVPTACQ